MERRVLRRQKLTDQTLLPWCSRLIGWPQRQCDLPRGLLELLPTGIAGLRLHKLYRWLIRLSDCNKDAASTITKHREDAFTDTISHSSANRRNSRPLDLTAGRIVVIVGHVHCAPPATSSQDNFGDLWCSVLRGSDNGHLTDNMILRVFDFTIYRFPVLFRTSFVPKSRHNASFVFALAAHRGRTLDAIG